MTDELKLEPAHTQMAEDAQRVNAGCLPGAGHLYLPPTIPYLLSLSPRMFRKAYPQDTAKHRLLLEAMANAGFQKFPCKKCHADICARIDAAFVVHRAPDTPSGKASSGGEDQDD